MSYILDALKKSEQERQQNSGPNLQTVQRPHLVKPSSSGSRRSLGAPGSSTPRDRFADPAASGALVRGAEALRSAGRSVADAGMAVDEKKTTAPGENSAVRRLVRWYDSVCRFQFPADRFAPHDGG